ncbi:uncharacterized protein TNCT_571391 [Trichonephila clavata]|uniref:Uncharacterized protein n=1 Tax=Trichonephila clavata TaxID=2740835 RepID=A0A8X6KEQ2_TRICU|nr:uncharacterized protein TNCT_571391 [Trichonephila clavata]
MTIIELNGKQTTFRNKVSKVKKFIDSFQPTDSTKDCIALKSKLDNIKSIIKELDILQNDYCALPDKVNLKDSLDTLSDLQEEAEETKDAVYGPVGIFLPWKLLLNGDIELLNHIISACQNCSVRKPVLILQVLLNVRIHLGQKFVRRVDNLTTWHNDEAC